jgi:arylsulfatase A-like enzyme
LLGVSLRSQAEGREQAAAREFVASETGLAEWHPIGVRGFPLGRMIRSERYKYIAFDRGDRREQLFDMSADPGELHDLSADVSHAAALAAHRRMLRQWCERTADDFGVAGE